MSVSYSINFMGPVTTLWFSERGLTCMKTVTIESEMIAKLRNQKVGDTYEYEDITEPYACGRIDIRDYSKDGYDGWDEYGLRPMHGESWGKLSMWLKDLKTKKKISYSELIERFETETGHKIRWWVDNEQTFANGCEYHSSI